MWYLIVQWPDGDKEWFGPSNFGDTLAAAGLAKRFGATLVKMVKE